MTKPTGAERPQKTRGGVRPGAGRPSLGADALRPVTVRLSPAQREKLARLGGAEFIRRMIDNAK